MPYPKANPDLPNAPGEKLLIALARHHALTVDQAAILCFFSKNVPSYTYASRHLKRLKDHRYVRRENAAEKKLPDVYMLAERGKFWLQHNSVHIDIDPKTHHAPPRGMHLAHRIAVTSFLIQVERSSFTIMERRNEWQLSRTKTFLTLPQSANPNRHAPRQEPEKVWYAPDAYVRLSDGVNEYAIAIELDRGTEDPKVWRKKVRQMVAFTSLHPINGTYPFQEFFGTEQKLRFAIVAAPGAISTQPMDVRARNLKQWTEQELKDLKMEAWAPLFYFRPIDALKLEGPTPETRLPIYTPKQVLCEPNWCRPFETQGVPLAGGLS